MLDKLWEAIKGAYTKDGSADWIKILGTLGGLGSSGAFGSGIQSLLGGGSSQRPVGYQGGIPEYTYNREQIAYDDTDRRPGSGGRRYFTDGTYTQASSTPTNTDTGTGMAAGGLASVAPKGYYLGGVTDGMADKVPASIGGQQPARLSDGEFVVPADVVSHLGNGNSNAGAKELYDMMDRIRKARTGRVEQGKQVAPRKYMPN